MNLEEEKLDNPVYHALIENHQSFAVNYNAILCYHPDYCPFGGIKQYDGIQHDLEKYSKLVNPFFIVGNKPTVNPPLSINYELVCLQMMVREKIIQEIKEEIITLDASHTCALYNLVNLVQPGYFKNNTRMLGKYYGIFKNHQLVAATGERMRMRGFVEVSAVVTHPDFTGRGFAKQLITHTTNHIFKQGIIPFLHVAETNTAAIALYKMLGFKTRRKMSFWNIKAL